LRNASIANWTKREYGKDAMSKDLIREWHKLNFDGNRLTQTIQAAIGSTDPLIAENSVHQSSIIQRFNHFCNNGDYDFYGSLAPIYHPSSIISWLEESVSFTAAKDERQICVCNFSFNINDHFRLQKILWCENVHLTRAITDWAGAAGCSLRLSTASLVEQINLANRKAYAK